jgi:hypothetical protein
VRDAESFFNYLLVAVLIVATLVGPLLQRWWRRRMKERGEKVEGPEPAEPMLPYEDVVEQIFGPYMQRRKEEHEARKRAAEGAVAEEPVVQAEVVEEAPAPVPPPAPPRRPAPEPVIRKIEVVEERPARLAALEAAPPVPELGPPRTSLEERLFANPRLTGAARLVLAAEILQPPRALRGRRPVHGGSRGV